MRQKINYFTFGGAYSIDRATRILGFTWFEEELPSEEEYEEAWENLKAHDYMVDYIITHTAPYEVTSALGYENHDEALEQVRFFQNIADRVEFKEWYFGHFHEDTDLDNYHCRIDEITQLEQIYGEIQLLKIDMKNIDFTKQAREKVKKELQELLKNREAKK